MSPELQSFSKEIGSRLQTADTLDQVKGQLLILVGEYKRAHPQTEIWFITGIIAADGPDYKQRNRERLRNYGYTIREKMGLVAFSAVDVFDSSLLDRIKQNGNTSSDFTPMWCEFISQAGPLLAGIILTPRWAISGGCTKEVDTVKRMGGRILDLEDILLKALVSERNNPHN